MSEKTVEMEVGATAEYFAHCHRGRYRRICRNIRDGYNPVHLDEERRRHGVHDESPMAFPSSFISTVLDEASRSGLHLSLSRIPKFSRSRSIPVTRHSVEVLE
ncbi:MAG: hypothetical protein R3D26_13510 [Cyanobacteriota/Melainabacteria group bacterium]